MMPVDPIITREIASPPPRDDNVHKGNVGRIVIIGGADDKTLMIGAPALAANAAFRGGAGLVQIFAPESVRTAVATLAPCATLRTLPQDTEALLAAVDEFNADVVALGPGLGTSLSPTVVLGFLSQFRRPVVVDADGLNLLARASFSSLPDSARLVLTPHPGEAARLLAARGIHQTIESSTNARRAATCALVEAYGGVVVLKGRGTMVTDGTRLYVNETGNAGMATGGAGDVLTGLIAAQIGQGLETLEAAILAVYLHGLAGDFAAEELGRWSMTATDLIEYLPEAFCEHDMSVSE